MVMIEQHEQRTSLQHEPAEFILSPRRWLILTAFSISTMTSNWIWGTWSPIASEVAVFWGVPLSAVDGLASIYFFTNPFLVFFAMHLVVDVLGLAKGLWLAFGLNALGSILRWVGMSSYWCVYIGALFCAYTTASTVSIAPMLAVRWFGAHERSTATAIGVLAFQWGGSVGLGSTIVINFLRSDGTLDGSVLSKYLFAQAFVATAGFLLLVFFMQNDEPPNPPSVSEVVRRSRSPKQTPGRSMATEQTALFVTRHSTTDTEDCRTSVVNDSTYTDNDNRTVDTLGDTADTSVKASLRLTVKYGWKFVFVYGISVGTLYSLQPFFAQFESDWSPVETGWLGFLFQTTGVLGTYVAGRTTDKYQNHGVMMRALVLLGAVFLGCFGIFRTSDQHWLIFASIMAAGFCLAASVTVGFDIGADMVYPANEATVGAVMQLIAQLYSFVAVTVGGWTTADTTFVMILWFGMIASGATILSISTKSRRPVG